MCLECFMICYSVFTDTYPIDCGNSYLLYGAAFMLVLCGSPLTVTWGRGQWCVTLIMPTTEISSWLVI